MSREQETHTPLLQQPPHSSPPSYGTTHNAPSTHASAAVTKLKFSEDTHTAGGRGVVERPPRVLFLHGLSSGIHSGTNGPKYRLLVEAFGKADTHTHTGVYGPDLGTRHVVWSGVAMGGLAVVLTVAWIVFIAIRGASSDHMLATQAASVLLFDLLLLLLWKTYILDASLVHALTVAQPLVLGGKGMCDNGGPWGEGHGPDVIVASSFGAVVAFALSQPEGRKLPMLLFCPAQGAYSRWSLAGANSLMLTRYWHPHTRTQEGGPALEDFPFCLVVHGKHDWVVPHQDSVRLGETAKPGGCRVELVGDDHKLHSITVNQMRDWVAEVVEKGQQQTHTQITHKHTMPLPESIQPSPHTHSRKNSDTHTHTTTHTQSTGLAITVPHTHTTTHTHPADTPVTATSSAVEP